MSSSDFARIALLALDIFLFQLIIVLSAITSFHAAKSDALLFGFATNPLLKYVGRLFRGRGSSLK